MLKSWYLTLIALLKLNNPRVKDQEWTVTTWELSLYTRIYQLILFLQLIQLKMVIF